MTSLKNLWSTNLPEYQRMRLAAKMTSPVSVLRCRRQELIARERRARDTALDVAAKCGRSNDAAFIAKLQNQLR